MSRVGGGPWSEKSKDQVPEENLMGKDTTKNVSWDRHEAYCSDKLLEAVLPLGFWVHPQHFIFWGNMFTLD